MEVVISPERFEIQDQYGNLAPYTHFIIPELPFKIELFEVVVKAKYAPKEYRVYIEYEKGKSALTTVTLYQKKDWSLYTGYKIIVHGNVDALTLYSE